LNTGQPAVDYDHRRVDSVRSQNTTMNPPAPSNESPSVRTYLGFTSPNYHGSFLKEFDAAGRDLSNQKIRRRAFISRRLIREPMATPMRVGVIGVGSMGQNHVRVYSEIAELVGIADTAVKAGGLVTNRCTVS